MSAKSGASEAGVPSALALSKLGDKIKQQLSKDTKKKDTKSSSDKKDSKKNSKKEAKKDSKKGGKFSNDHTSKTSKSSTKSPSKGKKDQEEDEGENVLLREIKNFGGSEADLDLVDDFSDGDSVVDFGNDNKGASDKSLASDVSKFMSELGLEGSSTDFVINDEDEEAKESASKAKKEKKDKKDKKEKKNEKREDEKEEKRTESKKTKNLKATQEIESNAKANKKEVKREAELEERKKQFNYSTANDIDQIMNEIDPLVADNNVLNSQHAKNQLILPPHSDWYNQELDDPQHPETELSDVLVERLYTKAKNLLAKENELFTHENNKTSSQKQFLSQLLTAGTLSDKIGAYSLLIQESPLHSVKYLTALLGLCRKKSRGSALQSIASLKDIFVQGGVLPDRKLRWFKNQPGLSSFASSEWLIVWAFEDWLKQYFFSLIQILEVSTFAW